MAGSRKWMIYTADDGTEYSVRVDESNSEALGMGWLDYEVGSTAQALPRGFVMRTITAQDPVSGARRQIPVGQAGASAFAIGGSILLQSFMPGATGVIAFEILSAVGEQFSQSRPRATDTGLTDGDAT